MSQRLSTARAFAPVFAVVCALTVCLLPRPLRAQDSGPPGPEGATLPTLVVPAGERLTLELETPLHTKVTRVDDRADFVSARDLILARRVVVPQGSRIRARVVKVKRAGRVRGRAELQLRFDTVEFPDGTLEPFPVMVVRAEFAQVSRAGGIKEPGIEGDSDARRSTRAIVTRTGQGAAVGAAVARGQGAIYGTAIGAGLGIVGILIERGPDLDLPRGMQVEVELTGELAVPLRVTRALASPAPKFADGDGSGPASSESDVEENSAADDSTARMSEAAVEESASLDAEAVAASAPEEFGPAGVPSRSHPSWDLVPPPEANYTLKVNVDLVWVEAVVRGPGGQVMEGLVKEDFRLFENEVEQEVSHFSRDEFPLALALVVDRSGSVASYMPELRRAAEETLSQLKDGDKVALFSFSSQPKLLEELTEDRERVAERIRRIRPGGGTNIADAVYAAAEYLAGAAPERRRAIILISDNQNSLRSRRSDSQLVRALLETETIVYGIRTPGDAGYGALKPRAAVERLVRKITQETGGEILDVGDERTLTRALEEIIKRFKLRYTLGYASADGSKDGRFRSIEIELSGRFGEPGRNYSTHHRRGYYAVDDGVLPR